MNLAEWLYGVTKSNIYRYIRFRQVNHAGMYPNIAECCVLSQIYCDYLYEGINENEIKLIELMEKLS